MPKTKHGITSWVKHNQLPSIKGKRKIQKACEELESSLLKELGQDITPQQDILFRSTVKAYGVLLLSELFINQNGILRKDQADKGNIQYHAVLEKSYLAFLNSIRLNLRELFPDGLSRKVEKVVDLKEYIDQEYGGKDKE